MSPKRIILSSAFLIAGALLVTTGLNSASAEKDKGGSAKPKIDLAFCIDTTGSMQGEIDAVKSKTKEIVAKLAGSKPAPEIRVGLVAYRDRGDDYVTRTFQFNSDIDKVVKDIASLNADGGGDEPEAVNEALHAAVNDLSWSPDKKTVKILFLIGDAGPKHYAGDYQWETESRNAISRGIQINTIACDGLTRSRSNLDVFERISKLADGKCEFLTYRQEIVDEGGRRSTVISSAGRTFKVEAKDADAWREGADKLVAKGAAAPYSGFSASSSAHSAGAFASTDDSAPRVMAMPFAGAPVRAARSRAMLSPAPAMAADGIKASYGASFGAPVKRGDSNLADIVLNATKEAARKKANIDYKD